MTLRTNICGTFCLTFSPSSHTDFALSSGNNSRFDAVVSLFRTGRRDKKRSRIMRLFLAFCQLFTGCFLFHQSNTRKLEFLLNRYYIYIVWTYLLQIWLRRKYILDTTIFFPCKTCVTWWFISVKKFSPVNRDFNFKIAHEKINYTG